MQTTDQLLLDDVYQLSWNAVPMTITSNDPLSVFRLQDEDLILAPESCLLLMCPDGDMVEALVLTNGSDASAPCLLPLGELQAGRDYRLIDCKYDDLGGRVARAHCGGLAAGTLISLPDGTSCPIEDLHIGDEVLTMDAGAKPVRWIGRMTMRATAGASAVTLGSEKTPLFLRPAHKVLTEGTAAFLANACDLADNTAVSRRQGGFVDYLQIVLDDHHIMIAQGIPVETQLMDHWGRAAWPDAPMMNHTPLPLPAQRTVATNVPSKVSTSLSVVTSPKTTPAIAIASGP